MHVVPGISPGSGGPGAEPSVAAAAAAAPSAGPTGGGPGACNGFSGGMHTAPGTGPTGGGPGAAFMASCSGAGQVDPTMAKLEQMTMEMEGMSSQMSHLLTRDNLK
eukprot:4571516-Pyramimonas_sp.AAC.1